MIELPDVSMVIDATNTCLMYPGTDGGLPGVSMGMGEEGCLMYPW